MCQQVLGLPLQVCRALQRQHGGPGIPGAQAHGGTGVFGLEVRAKTAAISAGQQVAVSRSPPHIHCEATSSKWQARICRCGALPCPRPGIPKMADAASAAARAHQVVLGDPVYFAERAAFVAWVPSAPEADGNFCGLNTGLRRAGLFGLAVSCLPAPFLIRFFPPLPGPSIHAWLGSPPPLLCLPTAFSPPSFPDLEGTAVLVQSWKAAAPPQV